MAFILDELEIGSNRVDPPTLPRPVISTLDTWDQLTQIDYPFQASHPGRRPGWNVPSIAVTSEAINTIRSSSNTRFQGIRVAIKTGFHKDPVMNLTGYRVVPNMAQSIQTDSPVQIQFSMTARTATAQAPFFALFRDAVKISQEYRASATANMDFLMSGSYIDPSPPKGWHTYDLRWHIDPGNPSTMTAGGANRTFQVSNLRAQ